MKDITLTLEIADGITLATLKEHMSMLQFQCKKAENGDWIHPEDYARFKLHLIPAMQEIIEYYGG
jgi:hypothetical protein